MLVYIITMKKTKLYLIVENIRSAHNVGSLLRSAEGLGVSEVALCGYTPYPKKDNDERLPYLAEKINNRIRKTALGAEFKQRWRYFKDSQQAIGYYRDKGIQIVSLEQTNNAKQITKFKVSGDIALVVGNEIEGVKHDTIMASDSVIYIPMKGEKESFNVTIAASMALFYLTLMV